MHCSLSRELANPASPTTGVRFLVIACDSAWLKAECNTALIGNRLSAAQLIVLGRTQFALCARTDSKYDCVGDGLGSTSAALQQYRGISDAGRFFERVMSKPYLNQVCDCFLPDIA